MEWLILLVFLILVVLVVLAKQKDSTKEFSYEQNGPLFSPAERSFFGVLNQAVQHNAVVFGKVRVADVLRPTKGMNKSNWQKSFNRISSKHFDYVVCSPDTLSVLAVVELDDKSHSKGARSARDRLLEDACSGAGLTLHRFRAAATYSISEVRNTLFPPLQEVSQAESGPEIVKSESENSPVCPKCASPLVKKVAKKGEHKGKEFWACSGFPSCRYIKKSNSDR